MLPESQLDRFIVRLSMGYPDATSELEILKSKASKQEHIGVIGVVTAQEIIMLQNEIDDIFVHDTIYEYIVTIAEQTRNHDFVELGVSPRGTIALLRMAKSKAYLTNRNYVIADDVQYVLEATLEHRLVLKPKAKISSMSAKTIIEEIRKTTPVPKLTTKVELR